MKRYAITGDLDPREILKDWNWKPKVKMAGWKANNPSGESYDLKYVDIYWLGLQISMNNERD